MNKGAEIEAYLLERGSWVAEAEICARFGVTERQLRQLGKKPGLCTHIAVSRTHDGSKGFRHVQTATTGEWIAFKHAQRRAAISVLRRIRALDQRRHNAVKKTKDFEFERDTGQGLIPGLYIGGELCH
jgi:hypothetical protein